MSFKFLTLDRNSDVAHIFTDRAEKPIELKLDGIFASCCVIDNNLLAISCSKSTDETNKYYLTSSTRLIVFSLDDYSRIFTCNNISSPAKFSWLCYRRSNKIIVANLFEWYSKKRTIYDLDEKTLKSTDDGAYEEKEYQCSPGELGNYDPTTMTSKITVKYDTILQLPLFTSREIASLKKEIHLLLCENDKVSKDLIFIIINYVF